MPSFRQASFLPRAMTSLFGQSYADWGLVVVDDGSPDATRETIAPFLTDHRVRYHHLTHNRGLGYALNAGLDLLQTELVAYLPSDDVFYADPLGSLVECIDALPDA